MESGTVIQVSRNGGMIRVRGESATALVEMLGSEGELEVGDVVRGNWTALGGETIYRGSEAFDVYIQDYS